MSSELLSKRRSEAPDFGCAKRLKVGDLPVGDSTPLVESILAVPLDIIFHQAPGTRAKPLLTRAEAQCFINISLLAQELDSLISITAKLCEQRHVHQTFADTLRQRNKNPLLTPLISILQVLGQQLPNQSLEKVKTEFISVFSQLRLAVGNLKQYSEQNWTLSESLLDAGPDGERVAKEKRKLSDIQDEVCLRITALLDDGHDSESVSLPNLSSFPPTETMAACCQRIMNRLEDLSSPSRSSQQSLPSSVKGQSQESGFTPKLKPSQQQQPSNVEKENDDPSQPQRQLQSIVVSEAMNPSQESAMSDDEECGSPVERYGPETQYAADALSSLMGVGRFLGGD
jgi:hypothetical protein